MNVSETTSYPFRVARAVELQAALTTAGVSARLLGGTAIFLSCPSARAVPQLMRTYGDVDLVIRGGRTAVVTRALTPLGLDAASRFNALHGDRRLLFHEPDGAHVDVLVDRFEMCHVLPLADRLTGDALTVTPTDLLLMKLQVARLNDKDVRDICALLLDHVAADQNGGIEFEYVAGLMNRDWGWWRTASETVTRVQTLYDTLDLPSELCSAVGAALDRVSAALDAGPRSRRWRARAVVGDRVPWRNDPEEVA